MPSRMRSLLFMWCSARRARSSLLCKQMNEAENTARAPTPKITTRLSHFSKKKKEEENTARAPTPKITTRSFLVTSVFNAASTPPRAPQPPPESA